VIGESLHSPLGRRLVAAFLLVALSSVAVLTLAALVATNQGLASAQRSDRQQAADRTAAAAATAYTQAGGWAGADLSEASAIADAAGARLVVENASSMMVSPGHGMGPGSGGLQAAAAVVEAPVIASGERVGTVRLGFSTATSSGRTVAWTWVIGAATAALAAALLVSSYVVRRLTRPLAATPVRGRVGGPVASSDRHRPRRHRRRRAGRPMGPARRRRPAGPHRPHHIDPGLRRRRPVASGGG
jgi:two-component system sensor histidine kinase BaeS